MTDFLNKMLKNSIDREAKKIASNGGDTEQDRYGSLLDSVKGRDIDKETLDNRYDKISQLKQSSDSMKVEKEREHREHSRNLQRIVSDVNSRERREADEFINRNKKYLDKAKETISRERNKSYFG